MFGISQAVTAAHFGVGVIALVASGVLQDGFKGLALAPPLIFALHISQRIFQRLIRRLLQLDFLRQKLARRPNSLIRGLLQSRKDILYQVFDFALQPADLAFVGRVFSVQMIGLCLAAFQVGLQGSQCLGIQGGQFASVFAQLGFCFR